MIKLSSLCRDGFFIAAALAAGLFGGVGDAAAGAKGANNVYVNVTSRLAQGDLGQARNTTDSVQYIGCYTQTYRNSSGVFEQVNCQARDTAGASYYCYATDPELVRAARSITGDSFLYFVGDTAGKCTTILVGQSSMYQPKQP